MEFSVYIMSSSIHLIQSEIHLTSAVKAKLCPANSSDVRRDSLMTDSNKMKMKSSPKRSRELEAAEFLYVLINTAPLFL